MTTSKNSTTILLASTDSSVIEATRKTVAMKKSINLIEHELTIKNFYRIIAKYHPDMILLDFKTQDQPNYFLYKLTSEFQVCPVIAIIPETKIAKADRAEQLGARDTIQFPFSSEDLLSKITREIGPIEKIQDDTSQYSDQTETSTHSHTFTVFSPKGGAGCTTIATNLAISLHKSLKEDVLLIDGKHLFGHITLYLNLLTGNSITDLLNQADMLDMQLINQVVIRHKSGIHVLPGPSSITEAQAIAPETLYKVIRSLQQVYPNIIIDGGNTIDENTVTYLDCSDKILLVLNPDIASMRDARQFMEISDSLAYPKDKTLFIINLSGRKADVQREEIENILKMKVFGVIPSDEEIALSSLNEGIPILLKKPRHPISKAFSTIAEELVKIIQTPTSG